ncbi:MAG: arginine--tRNA ligase [Ruminococcaceae bacterium]|nr:arginine--tRNA ligase [Oscillospiraceae bacterium]
MNIIENIKNTIGEAVVSALNLAIEKGDIPTPEENIDFKALLKLEIPKDKQHGDFACNIAMMLAKPLKSAPRKIAEGIVANLSKSDDILKVEIAGAGFINFYLTNNYLYSVLSAIEKMGTDYGKIDMGKGKKVMIEFVSANPTGPMHMGNARGGALGDCMASVMEYAGYDVTREFYINDAGNQIEKFGKSLEARYIQELSGEDAIEFPEDGYHGEDIRDHAKEFIKLNGDKYLNTSSEERKAALVGYALEKNIDYLKTDLGKYRIFYDVWFRESTLHDSGAVKDAIKRLTDNGYTYEEDGAIWLDCTKMGLEKNEVLVRQNGIPTYFAADIAYHINKLETRGFDLAIDIWGADHHGHVARMKGAMAAVGINPDSLEVVLMQLVRLTRDGEVVRMSKRTGKAITLSDLLEDVSIDVARFFFNMRMAGSHLDFDLDLAVKESSENPVYYVQYAHARICSIINALSEEGIKVEDFANINTALLTEESELELLKKLCELPEEIRLAAIGREPARITRYSIELATAFHSFYNACRVKGEDKELTAARLKLCASVGTVLRGILKMLKIDAPEKM